MCIGSESSHRTGKVENKKQKSLPVLFLEGKCYQPFLVYTSKYTHAVTYFDFFHLIPLGDFFLISAYRSTLFSTPVKSPSSASGPVYLSSFPFGGLLGCLRCFAIPSDALLKFSLLYFYPKVGLNCAAVSILHIYFHE